MSIVTRQHIITGLQALGIDSGMRLMVHSSLASFGQVQGGATTVIEALQMVLTDQGTLLMPSFCHGEPFLEDSLGYFDPVFTPTSNGAIPDTFWRMDGVYRSVSPTHAFAAWGHDAKRYTQNHHRTLTLGVDSPLGKLWRDGGSGLLIGVDYTVNSFHHVVETVTGSPCLRQRAVRRRVRLPEGRFVEGRTIAWRRAPCPINDSGSYAELMERQGLQRQVKVGSSVLTCFKLQDCFELVAELLRDGFKGRPSCCCCPIRPREYPDDGVSSDWDQTQQRLVPQSPSFEY